MNKMVRGAKKAIEQAGGSVSINPWEKGTAGSFSLGCKGTYNGECKIDNEGNVTLGMGYEWMELSVPAIRAIADLAEGLMADVRNQALKKQFNQKFIDSAVKSGRCSEEEAERARSMLNLGLLDTPKLSIDENGNWTIALTYSPDEWAAAVLTKKGIELRGPGTDSHMAKDKDELLVFLNGTTAKAYGYDLNEVYFEEFEKEGEKMKHVLKLQPRFAKDVESGRKTFEVRRDDRNYKVGDVLTFADLDKKPYDMGSYEVTYKLTHEDFPDGIPQGYCVLGIRKHEEE